MYLERFLFIFSLILGLFFFIKNIYKIYRNIHLGKQINQINNKKQRWKNVIKIAFGQSKMFTKPISGLLHFLIYVGFIIINLELLEIFLDGILGHHRFFLPILGKKKYQIFILLLEFFSLIVILSVIICIVRRTLLYIKRFSFDLERKQKKDANIILIIELFLMITFLLTNVSDVFIKKYNIFLFSNIIFGYIQFFPINLLYVQKISWWLHFLGILYFINYLFYSKHLHIILAFPSIFLSNINSIGKINNIKSITKEVQNMLNIDEMLKDKNNKINFIEEEENFGASDVFDLNQIQLLNAYTCTECGRCSEVCPAHITGKKLSPRKILMSTRQRLEEVSKNIDFNKGKFIPDGKLLLNNYITEEEIWSCTTCNACTEACPILLDPLSIIIDIRRYLIMEKSSAPTGINLMMKNIENNGSPWRFNQLDRLNWTKD